VPVPIVAVVPRQHGVDRIHEVVVTAGSCLHHCNASGCVRHEDVEQAVTFASNESTGIRSEIEDTSPVSSLDREDLSIHDLASDVLALEDFAHRGVREDRVDGACEDRPHGQHGDLVEGKCLGGNGERVRDHEFIDRSVNDPLNCRG
jgi:hypothetical protein